MSQVKIVQGDLLSCSGQLIKSSIISEESNEKEDQNTTPDRSSSNPIHVRLGSNLKVIERPKSAFIMNPISH